MTALDIIGLSRVAQFGGDNRPENFQTIKNIILGKDNTGSDGSDMSLVTN